MFIEILIDSAYYENNTIIIKVNHFELIEFDCC